MSDLPQSARGARLTDAELDEAFEYAHGSLRLTAALAELKERRKQDRYLMEIERLADVIDQFHRRHGVTPKGVTLDLVAACYRLLAVVKP
jgi:hypothetical protein